MTLADRTSRSGTFPEDAFPSRSWRSRLLRHLPEPPAAPRKASRPLPKPPGKIADFLLMSTLDQKAAPGAADDILDALVRDHLADSELRDSPPDEDFAASDITPPAAAPVLTEEQGTALLQREIETLLRDTPAPDKSPDPADQSALPQATDAPTPAAAADSQISSEELDTLLADQAPSLAPESLPAQPPLDANTQQQLSDAEGVLAEELHQLIADLPASSRAAATAPGVDPPAAAQAPSPAPPQPAQATAAPAKMVTPPAATAAPAGPLPLSPEEAHAAEISDVPAPSDSVPQAPPRRILHDLALLLAQIIDLPVGWISELDKNIIGVAAFLLLLGGVVLYALSRLMG